MKKSMLKTIAFAFAVTSATSVLPFNQVRENKALIKLSQITEGIGRAGSLTALAALFCGAPSIMQKSLLLGGTGYLCSALLGAQTDNEDTTIAKSAWGTAYCILALF